MGMSHVIFPVFLRCRGDKVVREFDSVEHIQCWVEPIDVENDEYEGWDSQGFPISLQLRGEASIIVKLLEEPAARDEVFSAFRDFAAAEGVPFERQAKSHDLHETYQDVKKAINEARNRLPWWRKALRRI